MQTCAENVHIYKCLFGKIRVTKQNKNLKIFVCLLLLKKNPPHSFLVKIRRFSAKSNRRNNEKT